MFLEGHMVIPRGQRMSRRVERRENGGIAQWTLHRDTCVYLKRAGSRAQKAPAVPYPATVACTVCKPQMGTEGGK